MRTLLINHGITVLGTKEGFSGEFIGICNNTLKTGLASQQVSEPLRRKRTFFFTNRVVPHWNYLSRATVDAPTLNTFKDCIS
jgi:hypothetical protein